MMGPPSWEKVKCPVCGREVFLPVLVPHIRREHGFDLREAREVLEREAKAKKGESMEMDSRLHHIRRADPGLREDGAGKGKVRAELT